MLDEAGHIYREADAGLMPVAEAQRLAAAMPGGATDELLRWLDDYPVRAHPELGRAGVVCPFTRPARRLDAVRVGLCAGGAEDEAAAFRVVRGAFKALRHIPARRGEEHYRTAIVAFPNCGGEAGIAMLHRVMKRHKYYGLVRMRTLGFLYPGSGQKGLWNPDFRPMIAPLPVMVVRHIVEQDARFVAHYHLQWLPFVLRFGWPGLKRLAAEVRRRG